MAITKYAIIDHVGSLTGAENKRIYQKVYAQAKSDELQAYTLKKVCIADSPYAREVTSKMKYRARYQKNPQKVYLICDTLDSTAESVMQIWESRNIPVEVFEVNGFMETHQLDLGEEPSRKRKIAETWAPAIGWSFSAPVTRVQREIVADNFCKRPDHDSLIASGETHFTKPFTSSEMFLEMNRCIAPDSEIDAFYQHIMYLWNTVIDGHRLIESSLEPDYIICKECGKPMKIHTGDCECPHCQTRFSEDIILTTYYEDSSDIDE